MCNVRVSALQGHTPETAKRYYRVSKEATARRSTAYAMVMGDSPVASGVPHPMRHMPITQVLYIAYALLCCSMPVI